MASAARSVSRVFTRTSPAATSSVRSSVRSSRFAVPTQSFRASGRRGYASGADSAKTSSGLIWGLGAVALGGAGAFYYLSSDHLGSFKTDADFVPTKEDYQKIYNEIARLLVEKDEYDDGSYAPVRPTRVSVDAVEK